MRTVAHRWVRQPNLNSSIYNRVANRADPFKNTLTVLEDPAKNKKIYLIGTTNSSTLLAHRTKKLVQSVKPSAVYVQTNPTWWSYAKQTSVQNQADFNKVSSVFECEKYQHQNNPRGIIWRAKFAVWAWAMKTAARLPEDLTPLTPGLQTKFALEMAEKVGAKQLWGGKQFDNITLAALRFQPDMYPHTALWRMRKFSKLSDTWSHNFVDIYSVLHTRGGETFAESIDRSRINFTVGVLNKIMPKQKKILIDARGQRIFRDLYETDANTVVAVVNQWHMQAVQTHWRNATGTNVLAPPVSPIADMDIDQIQDNSLTNDWLRDYTSEKTKSQPATHQNHLISYHKQNFEYERTRHTHHNSHEDVPEPGQKGHGGHH